MICVDWRNVPGRPRPFLLRVPGSQPSVSRVGLPSPSTPHPSPPATGDPLGSVSDPRPRPPRPPPPAIAPARQPAPPGRSTEPGTAPPDTRLAASGPRSGTGSSFHRHRRRRVACPAPPPRSGTGRRGGGSGPALSLRRRFLPHSYRLWGGGGWRPRLSTSLLGRSPPLTAGLLGAARGRPPCLALPLRPGGGRRGRPVSLRRNGTGGGRRTTWVR